MAVDANAARMDDLVSAGFMIFLPKSGVLPDAAPCETVQNSAAPRHRDRAGAVRTNRTKPFLYMRTNRGRGALARPRP